MSIAEYLYARDVWAKHVLTQQSLAGRLTGRRYSDPTLWCSLDPARCARVLLELFKGLRAVGGEGCNNTGQVTKRQYGTKRYVQTRDVAR